MSDAATEQQVDRTGVVLRTADHYGLIGSLLTPAGHTTKPAEPTSDSAAGAAGYEKIAVVLHPATGVDYQLYRKFAEFLAGSYGWPTLIYDLRGCGLSAFTTDKKNADITMSDWILYDVPAATTWLRNRYPEHKIVGIGHSVGAHGQLAVQGREAPVDATVMIASHAGVTNTVRGPLERAKVWGFFNVVTPVCKKMLGYVPTEVVGFGKQVPIGVLDQWASWTNKPGYFFQDSNLDLCQRFEEATGPVLSVAFSDDPWAYREAVDVLTDQLRRADVEKWDVLAGVDSPGEIGHMGFFRAQNQQLWPRVARWIRQSVTADVSA